MRLTVVMPFFDAMPYLEEAVASILNQTFTDFVLVAIDDGSGDGSLAYLRSLSDTRLRILQMPRNSGQGAARNEALRICDTEFVAFADADDVFLPRRFERQVSYLDRYPDTGMLGTRIAFIGDCGRAGFAPPIPTEHDRIRKDLLRGRHAVANSTLMFRTSVFARTGAFRISGAGEDWDLFLRMTEQTRVANLSDVLVYYRLHGRSTSSRKAGILRLRYAHASECALRREASLPERTFEAFCAEQASSRLSACADYFRGASLEQYRAGVRDVLDGAHVRGYARLASSALLAPDRLAQRLSRAFFQIATRGRRLPDGPPGRAQDAHY
jgi:glycosyltransferase involved in cell wall biosynthesis